jgi:hypothetical protein
MLYTQEHNDHYALDSDDERATYEEINFKDIMLHVVNCYNEGFAEIYKLNNNLKLILDSRIELPILDFSDIEKLKTKIKTVITFR